MALVSLPVFQDLASKYQLILLASLLIFSYFQRPIRLALLGSITIYAGYKFLIPAGIWVFSWIFWLAKAIAMLGFYIHFFQLGLGYLVTWVSYLSPDVHDWLVGMLEVYESSRS
ncbi:hypothetical protein AN958_03364 [Leucoagaricus sp. SymC.cos]|nr:hypothetical protein AN958_03364 [Leucoagaricus sp. SymC.cos]